MSTKKPWEDMGIARGSYYRAKKQGRAPESVRSRGKKGEFNPTPLVFTENFSAEDFCCLINKIVFAKAAKDGIPLSWAEEVADKIRYEIFTKYGRYAIRNLRSYVAKATHRLYLNEWSRFTRLEKTFVPLYVGDDGVVVKKPKEEYVQSNSSTLLRASIFGEFIGYNFLPRELNCPSFSYDSNLYFSWIL